MDINNFPHRFSITTQHTHCTLGDRVRAFAIVIGNSGGSMLFLTSATDKSLHAATAAPSARVEASTHTRNKLLLIVRPTLSRIHISNELDVPPKL
jgi:hypothetical protein